MTARGAVEIEDVTVSLGEAPVLRGVSASVAEGELLGLVGPNGAGKTTLLRTISGALAPDAGRVLVGGGDVHALTSAEASRRVAVVPQETRLSFAFDVRHVVEMGRYPHQSRFDAWTRSDREAVDRALERTGTAEFAERSVDEVSGGERQRVLLARALAQDAPVLLLDEPTASLDLNHAVETMELVRDLVDGGRTAVAAIHDLELAARYCDRIALLADGRIVATGTPAEVLESPRIEDAFGARTAVEPAPVGDGLSITALPAADDGPRVHVAGGGATAARAVGVLGAAGATLSVGPVPRGDRVVPTARSVDATVVETDRFGPIDGEALERARALATEADACVLADGPDADAWVPVARAADAVVVVDSGDGAASRALDDRAAVVAADVDRAVERVLNAGRSADAEALRPDEND